MEWSVWLALVGLFFAGGLTPGPAVFLIVNAALRYDFRSAMVAATGISSANLVWLTLAASGALALVTASPTLFTALKFVGAGVIATLGLQAMLGPLRRLEAHAEEAPRRSRLWARGVLLQVSNPGALVYFGLFLPAFFDASRPLWPQVTLMAATVTATEMFGLAVYAAGSRGLLRFLNRPHYQRLFNVAVGLMMIASAGWALWATR